MKAKEFLIGFVALAALTAGSSAMANEIYRWVDDQGNVHYEDRPSASAKEERLAMNYRRTQSSSVQKQLEAQSEWQAARQERKTAAAEQAEAAAAKKAEAEEKQKRCETYRARLEKMVQSRRLYREDENGERIYLDEAQMQQARQRVEDQITENCGS